MSRLRVIKYSFQLVHSVAEELKANHMGLSETDEKVVMKGVLDAFCSVFVEKNLLWFVYSSGLDRKVLENDAEPLILGNLFVMESLKDIAGRKMVENLNIYRVTNLFGQKMLQSREALDDGKDSVKCNIREQKKKEGRN